MLMNSVTHIKLDSVFCDVNFCQSSAMSYLVTSQCFCTGPQLRRLLLQLGYDLVEDGEEGDFEDGYDFYFFFSRILF